MLTTHSCMVIYWDSPAGKQVEISFKGIKLDVFAVRLHFFLYVLYFILHIFNIIPIMYMNKIKNIFKKLHFTFHLYEDF